MVAHVGRKAFGTAKELLNAGLLQGRDAAHRVEQHRFEVAEVAGDLAEGKIVGDSIRSPWTSVGFERAHQQFAGVVLEIAAMVIVAQHRHIGSKAGYVLEQDVVVLAGMQRHGHADAGGKIAGPHAAAKHDVIGVDASAVRLHAAHASTVVMDGGDFEILENLRAAAARPFGERLRDIDGIGIAVARYVNAADDILEIGERIQRVNLLGPHDVDRQAEYLGHRGIALQFLHAARRGGQRQRAALAIAGRLSGFRFETAIQFARVARQLRHVDALA